MTEGLHVLVYVLGLIVLIFTQLRIILWYRGGQERSSDVCRVPQTRHAWVLCLVPPCLFGIGFVGIESNATIARVLGWLAVFVGLQLALWAAGLRSEWVANKSINDQSKKADGSISENPLSGENLPSLLILNSVALGLGLAWVANRVFGLYCLDHPDVLMCKKEHPFPWATLAGVVAAPCILLTWYWRTVHKWRDIRNATKSNETSIAALENTRFKDAIDLLDAGDESVFGGLHGIRRLCETNPSYTKLAIPLLVDFIRLHGRIAAYGKAGVPAEQPRQPSREQGTAVQDGRSQAELEDGEEGIRKKRAAKESEEHLRTRFATNLHLRRALLVLRTLIEQEVSRKLPSSATESERQGPPVGSLAKTDFSGADLSGLDLSGLHFRMCVFEGADLTNCILIGTDFQNADMRMAVLDYADLKGANLRKAQLEYASCAHASFVGADAELCALVGANFSEADVTGANFRGAQRFYTEEKGVDWSTAATPPDE